ncbi:MAG: LysM peptidoglycan-binding domain-containing protein, partial [Mizugakiibacter sp.]|uniref:LysM peptidoglycan-binding domain-containing protein n=1 Tax=Mizugakiibacter sp. TaxID=1972610 RepID=UPI00320C5E42
MVLAGCATSPAPVVDRSIGGSGAAVASAAAPASGSYRVQGGDTLYSIAFRHGLDYRELARWNGIAAPYTIRPGESLRLTAPADARVAASAPAPRSPAVAEVAGAPTPAGVFEPVPEAPRTAGAPAPAAPQPAASGRPAA